MQPHNDNVRRAKNVRDDDCFQGRGILLTTSRTTTRSR